MSKPILVLNCGSSSIKYQMIDAENEELLAKGLVQRIATGTVGTIDHEVLADEQGEFHVDDPNLLAKTIKERLIAHRSEFGL